MSWTSGPSDWIIMISSNDRLLTADLFLPPCLTFFLGPPLRIPLDAAVTTSAAPARLRLGFGVGDFWDLWR